MTLARPALAFTVFITFTTTTMATAQPRERDPNAPAKPSTLFRENPTEAVPDERPAERPAQRPPVARPPTQRPPAPPQPADRPPVARPVPHPAGSNRYPVPDPAAQAQAMQLLRELFAEEYRRAETSSAATKELTNELIRQAQQMRNRSTPDDVASRYVLLTEAVALAAGIHDFGTALSALNDLADHYEVDGSALKLDLVARAGRQQIDPAKVEPLVRAVFDVVESTVAAGDLPGAAGLLSQADALARKSKNMALATEVQRRRRELRDLQGEYRNLADATARLRDAPDDAAANHTVGRFQCFVLGNWDQGLPMLAKSADAALRALASRDLKGAATGDSKSELAEAWWNLAEQHRGRVQENLRARAAHWYRLALPQLGGLKRTLAQKRIASAPGALADADANPPAGNPPRPVPGVVVVEGDRSPPKPAPPVGPVQPADRLLHQLATGLPPDMRPVPGERWDPLTAEPFIKQHARVGAPIAATVKLLHCSGLQRANAGSTPHAYATFRVVNPVDHAGISHNLDIVVRLEGQQALDGVQTVQGTVGQLTGTIRECRIGGWSGNKERGLSTITFYVMADDVGFSASDS